LKMKNAIAAIGLATIIFLSMLLVHLPLVRADYTVQNPSMPLDSDDLNATCAMKTRADGYFYVPNLNVKTLKIELLLDGYLVGDQFGQVSPYPYATAPWPDGTVNIIDAIFVGNFMGTHEGDPYWYYMADIKPDREINILDAIVLGNSFGHSGTYNRNLTGLKVIFNSGYQATPDVGGYVSIPQGASNFTVYKNNNPTGALVIFGAGPASPPVAYSTTFEFDVPRAMTSDAGKTVRYYVMTRVYVPNPSGQEFYLMPIVANANESVQNVKLDGISKAGSGSSFDLGMISGYHLLEFEFVDVCDLSSGGSLDFQVTTQNGINAWLARFRFYVPNYSNTEYRYYVKAHCNFSISDRFFIRGFADRYIDQIKLGGGWLCQDWQWNISWATIYGWGDGFNVPTGLLDPAAWRDIELFYGEASGGMLDFQVLSFTKQPNKIREGTPEFWASVMALPDYCMVMKDKKLYAGSQWYSDPGVSERKIVVSQELYFAKYAYDTGPLLWDARVRFDVGVAKLDLVAQGQTSFAITTNFTYLGGVEKPLDSVPLTLVSIGARVPTNALNVQGWEFSTDQAPVKSNVNTNFKIVAPMTVAAIVALATFYTTAVGALVGIAAGGALLNGIFQYTQDQQETPFTSWGHSDSYASAYIESMGSVSAGQSVDEVGFVRMQPTSPTHSGFVDIEVEAYIAGASVFTTIRVPVYT